jgi:outer membrane protein TolC
MRLLLFISLLLNFVITDGQNGVIKKITLADAIMVGLRNNAITKNSPEKLVQYEIEKAYFDLIYRINRLQILHMQADLSHDLERVANLRFETGDIDRLEKIALISRYAEVHTALAVMQDEVVHAVKQFKSLLSVPDDLVPADSVLRMYAIQKGNDPFTEMNSSPHSDPGKTEELETLLNQYFKQLQYFSQVGLIHADLILETAQIRFEKEDIDYVEYTGITEEAFRIKLDYLTTLNKYNQSAIELEFHAY